MQAPKVIASLLHQPHTHCRASHLQLLESCLHNVTSKPNQLRNRNAHGDRPQSPDFCHTLPLVPLHQNQNNTTREENSSPLLSTTTYRKIAYSCPKTTIAVGAGQVRCALYKDVQSLKIENIHFHYPKLLTTDWKVRGLTCQFGHRRAH
jgi:hypothetical protein